MTRSPTALSGCGARCGVPSPTPTARETLPPLLEDSDTWARTISPMEILSQIGSPFADTVDPTDQQAIAHAA